MGGLNVSTLAKLGTTAVGLIGATQKNTTKMDSLALNQQANMRKRQNLLDQQLATRRANIGAMGIGNSKSAAAAQGRLAKDAYGEMAEDEMSYKKQYQSLQEENDRQIQQNILNSVLSTTGKIIK